MTASTDSAERACLIVRSYMNGKTYAQVGAELGISGSRVNQIVRHHLRILNSRAIAGKWAEEIDWPKQGGDLRTHPRRNAALWLRLLGRYEAERQINSLNRELTPVTAPTPRLTPEQQAKQKETLLIQRLKWTRRRLQGESIKQIALTDGYAYGSVSYAINLIAHELAVRGQIKHRYASFQEIKPIDQPTLMLPQLDAYEKELGINQT